MAASDEVGAHAGSETSNLLAFLWRASDEGEASSIHRHRSSPVGDRTEELIPKKGVITSPRERRRGTQKEMSALSLPRIPCLKSEILN